MTDSEHADIHEDIRHIKEVISGNGKKGLVREADEIRRLILDLRQDFDRLETRIERALLWVTGSVISALCFGIYEIVMFALRHIKH